MTEYYNKMPFPINFRKIWTPGNEKITLKSGDIINGPPDILCQYQFLALVPSNSIASETQAPDFQFKDQLIDPSQSTVTVVNGTDPLPEPNIEVETQPVSPTPPIAGEKPDAMPFDPKTVNWLSVKIVDLEQAAKFLNIDISSFKEMKPKERKWKLVKLIKETCQIN